MTEKPQSQLGPLGRRARQDRESIERVVALGGSLSFSPSDVKEVEALLGLLMTYRTTASEVASTIDGEPSSARSKSDQVEAAEDHRPSGIRVNGKSRPRGVVGWLAEDESPGGEDDPGALKIIQSLMAARKSFTMSELLSVANVCGVDLSRNAAATALSRGVSAPDPVFKRLERGVYRVLTPLAPSEITLPKHVIDFANSQEGAELHLSDAQEG